MARTKARRCQRPSGRRLVRSASKKNVDCLKDQLAWLLPNEGIFAAIRFHGNITWTANSLVVLALCWSWSEARHVTDAFVDARAWSQVIVGCTPLSTYQGLLGALVSWTPHLLPVLLGVLHQRMEQIGGPVYRVYGWAPIAFDGSRATAARTKSNESAFCAKNYGKGKTAQYRKKKSKGMRRKRNQKNPPQPQAPQAWITLLWHMGHRLPWAWRLGPSNASEREHVIDMIETGSFPQKALFCGDAGFVGYPLWSSLRSAGHHFMVRVGGNVNLLREQAACKIQRKGQEQIVLCWPQAAIQKEQPPLRLRLVQVRIGKTRVWLLTSVLQRRELSRKAMVRYYKMRWGIELEFRGLKQTLDRAKLRCRNSDRLKAELNWSILAMAVAELLALKEQQMCCSKGRLCNPRSGGTGSLADYTQYLRALDS